MASMFKKPKRNFRKKLESADSDGENAEETPTKDKEISKDPVVLTVADLKKTREKKKKDKNDNAASEKGAHVLSFGDTEDDESEFFHVKKPSHSRKVVKELKKKALEEKESEVKQAKVNTQVSGAGEYSREKLKDLETKQKTSNGRHRKSRSPSIEEEKSKVVSPPHNQWHDQFSSVLQTGLIPDANMIHAIRKKRQQVREMGDYIPLDDTVKVEKTGRSRLIREDENDLSDEDSRVNFSLDTKAVERQKLRDVFLAAEQGSDQENSDHEREWEEQQIRKGVASHQVSGIANVLRDQQLYTDSLSTGFSSPHLHAGFPNSIPMVGTDLSNLSIEVIRKNLQDRLDSMTTMHRANLANRDQLDSDTLTTHTDVTSGQGNTAALEQRYRFFQETRSYVRDVIACLNEKVPRINRLEARYNLMQKTRAAKLIARRQQDINDQCLDYSSTGKPVPDACDPARQQRAADREARRARRRRTREKKSVVGHHEGLSSDDEETPSEISKYKTDMDLIHAEIGGVFDDAVEDYYEIAEVRTKFEEWKIRYNDSYRDAYIGLCLPKLLNPLIRQQLIAWNPLEESQQDPEEHGWYRDVVLMGHQAGVKMEPGDDDVLTIPSVVEKVIVPKLTDVASLTWDPLSMTQTCRLVNLTQKLYSDYPTINKNSKQLQAFLKAVVSRIRKTLDEDVFMPLYPKSVIENKFDEASMFFNRQFWTCVKLLGNILSWYGILEDTMLQHLSLDSLLNRYIVLGLLASGVNDEAIIRCQTIVSTLPKPWFTGLESATTMPQLENLCRYLDYAAGIMGNLTHEASDAQRRLSRERVKQIVKLATNMGALDHASAMKEKFAIKL